MAVLYFFFYDNNSRCHSKPGTELCGVYLFSVLKGSEMKKFYLKSTLLIFFIFIILAVIEVLSVTENYSQPIAKLTDSEEYLNHMDGPNWINPLIEKVSVDNGEDTLIIGDSVCRQLFIELSDINDTTCIAPAIAPFTICGQYVLAKLFIENHPNASDIYLLLAPTNIHNNDFDINYSYQYLVMPLVETDKLDYLDNSTIERIEELFGRYSTDKKFVYAVDKSGLNRKLYLNYIETQSNRKPSDGKSIPIFFEYFPKIEKLCEENNVTLHFLSCPISDSETRTETSNNGLELLRSSELNKWYNDYKASVKIYPQEMFSDDTHFGYPYNSQTSFNKIINETYKDTGLLEKIKMY